MSMIFRGQRVYMDLHNDHTVREALLSRGGTIVSSVAEATHALVPSLRYQTPPLLNAQPIGKNPSSLLFLFPLPPLLEKQRRENQTNRAFLSSYPRNLSKDCDYRAHNNATCCIVSIPIPVPIPSLSFSPRVCFFLLRFFFSSRVFSLLAITLPRVLEALSPPRVRLG